MNIIHLKDVLTEIKKGDPFSVSFVTLDQSRNTGGDIMQLDDVIISFQDHRAVDLGFQAPEEAKTNFKKSPGHYEHATRNVMLKNGMRRKFHLRLLLTFNGKKVFY